jgi:chromosome segregation ATPase
VKSLLIRLLAAVGLVPATRYESLRRATDELAATAHGWKAKARQSKERLARLSGTVKDQTREIENLRLQVADLQALHERLAVAERDLAAARELLMAVEVKLDILEGAANVLDTRTRSVVSRQRSGASV